MSLAGKKGGRAMSKLWSCNSLEIGVKAVMNEAAMEADQALAEQEAALLKRIQAGLLVYSKGCKGIWTDWATVPYRSCRHP